MEDDVTLGEVFRVVQRIDDRLDRFEEQQHETTTTVSAQGTEIVKLRAAIDTLRRDHDAMASSQRTAVRTAWAAILAAVLTFAVNVLGDNITIGGGIP